ncbi:class I tRNA ligase family protein [Clavibacter sp. VKM Ac-2872]|uniref:class I tRNA ligase family protein n=1 Tax=Clavibacter sp. VKM Ac-2872 TaxID=2783812 RepID=UPI00188A3F7A|nr:class I tRNA ligase family protein [Clavibacter sp. VKM Ac-2872]MBF4623303.1 class I tRNA ligase family protein [Clavibacter sp. VKM Ac-2872]
MPGRLVVTVPPASAHSYDHVGYAVDLVVAGAIASARDGGGSGARGAAALVATRDEHSIPAVAAGPPPGLAHLAGIARRIAGRPVVVAGTDTAPVQDLARAAWSELDARGALESGTYERMQCSGCRTLADSAGSVASCPTCGGTDLVLRAERNWFLRTGPFSEEIAAWRDGVALRGPAAPLARAAPAPPARLSVSRAAERTDGVGVPVPGDAEQVVHSGFVAACSYLLSRPEGDWAASGTRVQVCGKGLANLHLTLVPLLCAALGLPGADVLHVHHHVTVDGRSPQSAAADGVTASRLLEEHGPAALRWWILRLGLPRRDATLRLRDLALLADRELPRLRADALRSRGRLDALDALDLGALTRALLARPADAGGEATVRMDAADPRTGLAAFVDWVTR